MKKFLFNNVLPFLIFGIVILWCASIRVHHRNREMEEYFFSLPDQYILTLWHGRIFYLFYHLRRRSELHLLISPSEDGDLLARLARLMGYSVIRGSTYKRAVPAARALIKVLRSGRKIVIIADGSRGPRCKAQPGSIQLASLTGAPIFPMTFEAKRKIVLNSWDRFVLPLPFSLCTLNYGQPIKIPRKADKHTISAKQKELENALNQITLESELPPKNA